ncbi:DUF555 domain-containing protein [Halovivax gelatinilyticus]|uniref:DUF555 domain-containing protein n=1 Tax=Halovivax gelatinilyticus TaxID=2961597 RepID=UPI0020CA8007|nr:DUF555 domain-containing protein [Halovivax gelatinilyticus]
MHCRVVVEAAVPVFDVSTPDEAIRIAISKTGEMLNPDLNYVEINMGERTSPSGEELPPAFIAADEALVALELEMTVFNVERDEHAARIARKEIGQRLENIPLEVLEVEELPDEDEDDSTDESVESDDDGEESDVKSDEDDVDPDFDEQLDAVADELGDSEPSTDESTDDDVLPEFEDLVE